MRATQPLAACLLLLTLAAPAAHADPFPQPPPLEARVAAIQGGDPVSQALRDVYAAQGYAPAWFLGPGVARAVAHQLVAALCAADAEGLSPGQYDARELGQALGRAERGEEDWLAVDLRLTRTFLRYADDLATGQLSPARFGWPTRPRKVDLAATLEQALLLGDLRPALEALAPPYEGFAQLRAALWHYQALADAGGWPQVPPGKPLAEGARDERVRVLRQRLAAEGDLPAGTAGEPTLFDAQVTAAVERFQRRHGLAEDGKVAAGTLAALRVPVEKRLQALRLNLERWRWMPASLGERHVLVNLAGYQLEAWEGGQVVQRMKVVIGQPEWRTPLLADRITHLVVNPRWAVPGRIVKEEMLPQLKESASAAARLGLDVIGPDGKKVAPESVDWGAVDPESNPYRFRQAAGPSNPLGTLKFVTTNNFDVILHDTPVQRAFRSSQRAMSHGCVRLENAEALAGFVLHRNGDFGPEQLEQAVADAQTDQVELPEPVPVHLLYWTAFVEPDGTVHFRPDVYGEDARLAAALPRAQARAEGGSCPADTPPQGVGGAGPTE